MDGGNHEKEKWSSCVLCYFSGDVFNIDGDLNGTVSIDAESQPWSKLDQWWCHCGLCLVLSGGRLLDRKTYGKV